MSQQPQITAHARALAQAGRVEEAYHLLSLAAEAGDTDALMSLAYGRLSGNAVSRDLAEARRLFGRAAELGHPAAETIYTAMLANGGGGERRWDEALQRLRNQGVKDKLAQRELDLIQAMGLNDAGDPLNVATSEIFSQSPHIIYFRGFLTPVECNYLIDIARPQLQPAVVVHPQTGESVRDPIRTSDSAAFPFVAETPALHAINRRIASAAQVAPGQGEPLQVLRYRPGEEYKPHSDALGGMDNQRTLTFLVYLNEGFEGGETLFIRSGLKVRGRTGDAILFRNVEEGGRADPMAVHAGLPVTAGEKLLLSKWIRERPLDLTGPPGRPF